MIRAIRNISPNATWKFSALSFALTTATLGGVPNADAASMTLYDGSSSECEAFTPFFASENTCISFEFDSLPSDISDVKAVLPLLDGVTIDGGSNWYDVKEEKLIVNDALPTGDGTISFNDAGSGIDNVFNDRRYSIMVKTIKPGVRGGADVFAPGGEGYYGIGPGGIYGGQRYDIDINQTFDSLTSVPTTSTLPLLLGGLGVVATAGRYRRKIWN